MPGVPRHSGRMLEPRSVTDLLRARAHGASASVAYSFLSNGERESARLTYAELDQHARAIAASLQGAGAAGERVLLLYPQGLEFVAAFYGCLYAGAVAVPAYPPRNERNIPRLRAIVAGRAPARGAHHRGAARRHPSVVRCAPRRAETCSGSPPTISSDRRPTRWIDPGADSDTLAFLQYTSGSTATPKGVMVSHGNLLHNLQLLQEGWRQSAGLGGRELAPPVPRHGADRERAGVAVPGCALRPDVPGDVPPEAVPLAAARYRATGATLSGGPNFAFDLCVQAHLAGAASGAGLQQLERGLQRRRAGATGYAGALLRRVRALRAEAAGPCSPATGWRRRRSSSPPDTCPASRPLLRLSGRRRWRRDRIVPSGRTASPESRDAGGVRPGAGHRSGW